MCTLVEEITKTIGQATDTWVDIEIYFTATSTPPWDNGHGTMYLYLTGGTETLNNPQGYIDFDQYEIYEYVDVADPAPTCTLAINVAGTVVTNETSAAANDGSISVAITGGTAPFQYSKDNGATWQSSNLFTGLDSGSYNVKVREQNNTSCVSSAVFTVNATTPSFDFTLSVTHETVAGAGDGIIEATVTGTGGPFQFSRNGGITWQTSNVFSALVPGTYYITVKRNDGTQQLTKSALVNAGAVDIEKTWHSKNHVTLQKLAVAGWGTLINYRLYDDIRVEDVADSGIFVSKMKVELPPDSAGKVLFYLQEAFRDCFSFAAPAQNTATINRLTDRIKRFKSYTGELQNQEATPAVLTASLPSLVLWGGISKEKFPGLNYFSTFLAANKKFLTWAPLEKYVDRTQEDYLNFWIYGNYTSLKLRVKAYFDDATNQTSTVITKTGTKRYELYQIPAGPTNSGAVNVNAAKNLIKYELSLLDQADVVISEVRTFHVIKDRHPLTRNFMYLNSLGSFEVLRFIGQAENKKEFDRVITQRFLPDNYSAQDGEFAAHSVTSVKRNSYSSGYIKGRMAEKWHDYMEDFLLSPVVYDVTNGDRLPVVTVNGELQKQDQNYERFFRFEAKPAYDNESFTPSDI